MPSGSTAHVVVMPHLKVFRMHSHVRFDAQSAPIGWHEFGLGSEDTPA